MGEGVCVCVGGGGGVVEWDEGGDGVLNIYRTKLHQN